MAASALAQPVEKRSIVNSTALLTGNNDLQASYGKPFAVFQPKVLVVNYFWKEAQGWLNAVDFKHNITIPGLSQQYPTIHCTEDYAICQLTTGMGEINAAASMNALGLSPLFDLSHTYFLMSGIGGGEPVHATLGSVAVAQYAVQVALEYQVSPQDFGPAQHNWTAGYWAYKSKDPWLYPGAVYGSEVFEVNGKLRDRAVELAKTATLKPGNAQNIAHRLLYTEEAARSPPAVVKCDTLTSDTYFSGNTLSDYFTYYASMMTNGTAQYCMTAQEDNAGLEAIVRLHRYGLMDFNRVVVMRSASDFTRPPPSKSGDTVNWFTDRQDGGSAVAFANLPIAGMPFVNDVLKNWDGVYYAGKQYGPENYTGDFFNALGGTPSFGKPEFQLP